LDQIGHINPKGENVMLEEKTNLKSLVAYSPKSQKYFQRAVLEHKKFKKKNS
jgi:hypothetical protein